MKKETGSITVEIIKKTPNGIETTHEDISFSNFLVNKGETAIGKYGDVLNKVIEVLNK